MADLAAAAGFFNPSRARDSSFRIFSSGFPPIFRAALPLGRAVLSHNCLIIHYNVKESESVFTSNIRVILTAPANGPS
jgi:hypothetical protein